MMPSVVSWGAVCDPRRRDYLVVANCGFHTEDSRRVSIDKVAGQKLKNEEHPELAEGADNLVQTPAPGMAKRFENIEH
jgi:hypothetical protein